MKRIVWVGVFAPLVMGILASIVLEQSEFADAVFTGQYSFDIAGLLSRIGIFLTLLLIGLRFIYKSYQDRLSDAREQEASQQTESHQRFLQRLNHELKNPLMIIKLGLINLQNEHQIENDATLQRVEQQSKRLEKLVKDLRWLTELEANKLDKSELNVPELIEDAIESSDDDLQQRQIDVDIQKVPWQVGSVMGDRDLLVMGIRNLIDNAVKFTEKDGQIRIRVQDDGNRVTIEVADDGMGISGDDSSHVFEELYRGQNANPVAGSGLGLSLVERIVSLHGGRVNLHSRHGDGTSVTLHLNHQ